MLQQKRHVAYNLSYALAALMVIQSCGGLLIRGLYRDNAWVTSALQSSDLVVLFCAVPTLLIAMTLSRRGSLPAYVVWIGTIYYALYNNFYYLCGSAYNDLFLVYVAIFSVSAMALIAALANVDLSPIEERVGLLPRVWIAAFALLLAATLGVMWIGQSIAFVISGVVPQMITDGGGSTNLVSALDLSMIVVPLAIGATWLIESRPWGVVVLGMELTACVIISVMLLVTAPVQAAAGIKGAWTMVPLWAALGVACLIPALLLLRGLGAPVLLPSEAAPTPSPDTQISRPAS